MLSLRFLKFILLCVRINDLNKRRVNCLKKCTAQVVGIDDVAASNSIGVLNGAPG